MIKLYVAKLEHWLQMLRFALARTLCDALMFLRDEAEGVYWDAVDAEERAHAKRFDMARLVAEREIEDERVAFETLFVMAKAQAKRKNAAIAAKEDRILKLAR